MLQIGRSSDESEAVATLNILKLTQQKGISAKFLKNEITSSNIFLNLSSLEDKIEMKFLQLKRTLFLSNYIEFFQYSIKSCQCLAPQP